MEKRYTDIKEEELHPTYQMILRVIGKDAAEKMGQEFGGTVIYFPRLDALTDSRRKERDKKIVADHESGQYTREQLGRKYKICAMGIKGVLERAKTHRAPSEVAASDKKTLIEQIRQTLGELDEEDRRMVLRYTMKRRNSRGV